MLILIDLGRRLQTTRCGEEDNVCEHFERLAEMCEQLAAMGKSVSDNEFASILMGSLPSSYAPTLSGIAAAAEISAWAMTNPKTKLSPRMPERKARSAMLSASIATREAT